MTQQVRTRTKNVTLTDDVLQSPVDRSQLRTRRRWLWLIVLVLVVIVGWLVWNFTRDSPVDYASDVEHFKYGSIGSEPGGSLAEAMGGLLPPEPIFRVLPAICPEMLPETGYAGLGFVLEEGKTLPIGVSRRFRLGLDQVGLNCSVCHTGTYRTAPDAERQVVLGMPSHQLWLQDFFRFVLNCTLDPRFNADNLLGTMEEQGIDLGWFDRTVYRLAVIDRTRQQTLELQRRLALLMGTEVTEWGPGRVDTFNPYKGMQFNWSLDQLPRSELMAGSDFPSLWNQEPRDGMELHWDGNNDSVDERNLSASLGAGVTPVTIDHERLDRVREWIWTLPPPEYPFPIDSAEAARGQELYDTLCLACHADARFKDGVVPEGATKVGTVEPIDKIQTDRHRLDSYTYVFSANQYTLYPDTKYRFHHFRKTNGYANQPLDGIWARAPYLHNGAVPTLRDLLEPPEQRPAIFYRGYDVFDPERVGFVHDVAEENGTEYFRFDTSLPNNGNGGHLYALDLPPEDKDAIVEYMKTF